MTQHQEYILPSSDAETQRLERQALLYGCIDFLKPFLENKPERILDVGCGTGHFTRLVAEQLPSSKVLGLDKDESRLCFARSNSNAFNLSYELGDLMALPSEPDRFDLVFSRLVLGHCGDPIAALREMARVSRPGGRIVAYDLIHDGIWFSPPKLAFEKLLKTAIAFLRDKGADPNQGLHLPINMKRAGLADVQVKVIPHSALSGDPIFDAYRENWLATICSLEKSIGSVFEPGLVNSVKAELAPANDEQFCLEITVLAHGTKA